MKHNLQPVFGQIRSCTMLMITNLLQPEWISVNFTEKLLEDVLCISNETNIEQYVPEYDGLQNVCKRGFMKFEATCFTFAWFTAACPNKSEHKGIYQPLVFTSSEQNFAILLQGAILPPLPLFLKCARLSNTLHTLHIKKHLNNIYAKVNLQNDKHLQGLLITHQKYGPVTMPGNLFACQLGGFVLQTQVCDGSKDCVTDNSDEEACQCQKEFSPKQIGRAFCKIVQQQSLVTCGPLFQRNKSGACQVFGEKPKTKHAENKRQVFCPSGHSIIQKMMNDMMSDCDSGADELHLIHLLRQDIQQTCRDPNLLPCRPGLEQCFKIKETCFFKLGDNGRLKPCGNGGNLQQCEKYDCNYDFKCPLSYCISWSDVCDGKWDCINGADEDLWRICKNQLSICSNMFRCDSATWSCIPLYYIYDGKDDCTNGNDELLCKLVDMTCTKNCLCLGFRIFCQNETLPFSGMKTIPFRFIGFVQVNITVSLGELHKHFTNISYLRYEHSSLQQICSSSLPPGVRVKCSGEQHTKSIFPLLSTCFGSFGVDAG